LCYLHYRGDDGANADNIHSHCVPTVQDTSRFKHLLDDLYSLGKIDRKDRSDLHKGLITYNITPKGRETMQALRSELVKDIIPPPIIRLTHFSFSAPTNCSRNSKAISEN
jgi:hypothetical protein